MNTIELFGIIWNNESLDHSLATVNKLTNGDVGSFCITLECLQIYMNEFQQEDYYKILSLIHEKTIFGKSFFIYSEKEYDAISKLKLDNFSVIEYHQLLDEFPKNIFEIQIRALMMLYKQNPKYGADLQNFTTYDFFCESYPDWLFVLESMRNKGWLDIKIQKAVDGRFALGRPMLIGEQGWNQIETNIDINYSKQVFVAMWFDPSMDKAYEAIEKAVTECGLHIIRLDRKEHNNEISGEILFEIKKSRIVIADVTNQRNGVYFEAGFAMGHQKTVIWSCKEDDLIKVHFDTRQYNHVLWNNETELYTKMKNRLLATLAIEA